VKDTKGSNDSHEELQTSSLDDALSSDMGIKLAVRQPKGECDPERELPCSCPRRTFMDPPSRHGQQQEGPGGVHQETL
jgi:hypothetical protein